MDLNTIRLHDSDNWLLNRQSENHSVNDKQYLPSLGIPL